MDYLLNNSEPPPPSLRQASGCNLEPMAYAGAQLTPSTSLAPSLGLTSGLSSNSDGEQDDLMSGENNSDTPLDTGYNYDLGLVDKDVPSLLRKRKSIQIRGANVIETTVPTLKIRRPSYDLLMVISSV